MDGDDAAGVKPMSEDEEGAPGQDEPTTGARAKRWVMRALGHWLVGLVCVPMALCVMLAARVFMVLGKPPSVRVEPLLPLYPFAWWSDTAVASPLAFQVMVAYALVVWFGLTAVRERRDPAQRRAASPLLVTAALVSVSGLGFRLLPTVGDIKDAVALFAVWAIVSLPVAVVATLWTTRLSEPGDARPVVLRWAVAVGLFVVWFVAGVVPTPPIGASLSERDAWAREHMGAPYVQVASDLTSSRIVIELMGEDVRVGPIAASDGELVLTMDEGGKFEGVMLLDDGVRAARCEVDYDLDTSSIWSSFNDAVCTRGGLTFYLRAGHPDLYSLESTDASARERIMARHPERFAGLEVELRAAMAQHVAKKSAYDAGTFALQKAEAHARSESHQFVLEGVVLAPEADAPRIVCKAVVTVDFDGEVFVPEDEDSGAPCGPTF
jgi:hypothetical protein